MKFNWWQLSLPGATFESILHFYKILHCDGPLYIGPKIHKELRKLEAEGKIK